MGFRDLHIQAHGGSGPEGMEPTVLCFESSKDRTFGPWWGLDKFKYVECEVLLASCAIGMTNMARLIEVSGYSLFVVIGADAAKVFEHSVFKS